MISPHAVAREWALFILSLDADRARRAAGLPDRESEELTGRHPVKHDTLLRQMKLQARPVVQAKVFSGG